MPKFLLFVLCCFSSQLIAQGNIHYIANEGILIESGNHRLLIDALFDDYYEDYLHPSKDLIKAVNEKKSPYQKIDLFLSTHAHRDHFYSKMVANFLIAHSETKFISTQQAIDSLARHTTLFNTIAPQLTSYTKGMNWQKNENGEIIIGSAFVRHGGKQNYNVDNLIFVLDVNGKKILHLGDAEMDISHFHKLRLQNEAIDVALVPYWFLAYSPGIEIISQQIRPAQLIAIHYPKVGDPKSLKLIRENFPDAVVFMKTGEKVEF
ncbi:MAG: MBL fold metallo-hydrolase [Reichenbachiella sp.]|uniref:MBL fold metallo-hydrolase n=1 Tax=Reichenbachiella sp. TaxID=2184521 RepID=UPI0032653330